MAPRTDADKKGGHLARSKVGGGLLLREAAQCPDEDEKEFQVSSYTLLLCCTNIPLHNYTTRPLNHYTPILLYSYTPVPLYCTGILYSYTPY